MRTRGFTLPELMMVIAIVTVVLVAGVPNYLNWRERARVNEEATRLVAVIQKARAMAKKTNTAWAITTPTSTTYQLARADGTLPTVYTLRNRVTFSAGVGNTVTFNPPWGTHQSGTPSWTLSYNTTTRNVTLTSLLGEVIVK